MHLIDLFNTRELATIVWAAVALCGALLIPGVRKTAPRLLRSALAGKLVVAVVLLGVYTFAVAYGLYRIGLWTPDLLKDTVFWFLGGAVVMLFGVLEAGPDQHYFRKLLRNSVGLVIVLQFLTNTYTFALWVELIAIPVLTFVVTLQAVAERSPESAVVGRILSWVTMAYGFTAVGISLLMVAKEPSEFFTLPNARSFALPILLTVSLLPFIHLFGLYAEYETNFTRLQWLVPDVRLRRHAKLRILRKFHLNLWALKRWARTGGLGSVQSREELDQRL